MHKKIMLACMAIAAFAAFVIAPAASASPVLTSGTTVVPVGTSITATETLAEPAKFTGSNGTNVECHAHLTGTVTENSGTKIAGTIPVGGAKFTGTGAGEDCTSSNVGDVKVTVNSELCLETVKATDNVSVTGCGTNPVTFTLLITATATSCKYSTSTVTGTFVTNAAATVTVWEQPAGGEAGNSFLCPASGKLDMHFLLYTTDGTGLTVS